MKLLTLLAVAVLLTGCAAAEDSGPTSAIQSPSVEVTSESQPEVTQEPEPTNSSEEVLPVETDSKPEDSASTAPAKTNSVQPSASKEPTATQKAAPVETQAPSQTQDPTPEPVESKYSMANIAKNNSTKSCWAAISGKAYDLTDWISKHPGGTGAIVSICGTDATSVFLGKHGGQSAPASALSSYLLGDVNG